MRFFDDADLRAAVAAMLANSGLNDPSLLGLMNGIKRRARRRAMIRFVEEFDPAPPDRSITTIRALLLELFGHSVSNNVLPKHFGTPSRKADDRVDMEKFNVWRACQLPRLKREAVVLMLELDIEWPLFTKAAAYVTGQKRKEDWNLERALEKALLARDDT